jgi:hypothetical protein
MLFSGLEKPQVLLKKRSGRFNTRFFRQNSVFFYGKCPACLGVKISHNAIVKYATTIRATWKMSNFKGLMTKILARENSG